MLSFAWSDLRSREHHRASIEPGKVVVGGVGTFGAKGKTLVGHVSNGLAVIDVIGEGGMGLVYLARQQGSKEPRAIKIIGRDSKDDRTIVARFKREAQVLRLLDHPNIVKVLDFGQLHDELFIAMEFINGPDLQTLVKEDGPLDLLPGLGLLRDVAGAVRYAHAKHVVHRDLKPGNIMLSSRDTARSKVIDFGLVKLMGEEAITKLTMENQIVGSPLYIAPEQAKGIDAITEAADVYALAGVAYFIFTGSPVFPSAEGTRVIDVLRAQCLQEPPRLTSRRDDIPEFLDTLLLACLAKDPGHRPFAEELYLHLSRLYDEEAAKQSAASAPAPTGADASAVRLGAQIWTTSDATGKASNELWREVLVSEIEDSVFSLGQGHGIAPSHWTRDSANCWRASKRCMRTSTLWRSRKH